MAVRDFIKEIAQIEAKRSQAQAQLAETNQELAALEVTSPPTSDLVAEEQAALKRVARREALGRVRSALSAELAKLQAQLAQVKEEERRAQKTKIQAEIDKAKATIIAKLWEAYAEAEKFAVLHTELDKMAPNYFSHRAHEADRLVGKVLAVLEYLKAAEVSIHGHTFQQIVKRIDG